MRRDRSGRGRVLGCFIVAAGAAGFGCAHDHAPASSACGDPLQLSLPDCTMGPDRFSDEACTVFDDAISARASTQDARAATITAPTEGQVVPLATPFAFAWSAPLALRPRLRAPRAMTLADELARWTSLVPEAQAHCEPFSGRGYELRFSVNGATVFRRQTSALAWTPNARDWGIIAGGGRTVDLAIYTALFNNGTIGSGSGPFRAMATRRFVVR